MYSKPTINHSRNSGDGKCSAEKQEEQAQERLCFGHNNSTHRAVEVLEKQKTKAQEENTKKG